LVAAGGSLTNSVGARSELADRYSPTPLAVVVVTVEVFVTALITMNNARVERATIRTVAAGQMLVR
jgi:hypothetical protein